MGATLSFSCKQKENEDNPPQPVTSYTTLAQLLSQSNSSSSDFDIQIKDLVVTAIYENYAQLEDGTCGAQLNKSDHGLKPGQKFDGKISGKARNTSGALVLSQLVTSQATSSTVSTLPCTTATLPEIQSDKSKFINRRVKLENVTFVNGFNGSAGGSGSLSQRGVQISATCRPANMVIPDGTQGDLICYPSSAACYVFAVSDFEEHVIDLPIFHVNDYGVYSSASTAPRVKKVYRAGTDQYSWTAGASSNEFRLQNYNEEWVLALKYPNKYKLGMQLTMDTIPVGLSDFTEGSSSVILEKQQDGVLWLMDYTTDTGYVLRVE